MTKKFRCLVCGYIHEGENAPEECPLCHVGAENFEEIVETDGDLTWTDEHRLGVAQGVDPEILKGLRDHFAGECSEVGMYLAMSRQADREGYPAANEIPIFPLVTSQIGVCSSICPVSYAFFKI